MNCPDAHLYCASLVKGKLVFEKEGSLRSAIQQGVFLLKVPEGFDFEPGIKLCREFYLPETDQTDYRGYRAQPDIYFDREHFQTEHILVDRLRWAARLPAAVVHMALIMDALGQVIFQAALREMGVAEHLWQQLSGGAVTGQGAHWFAASHYRPELRLPGCAEHRDTGFVTLLYTRQPGRKHLSRGAGSPLRPGPVVLSLTSGHAWKRSAAACRCLPGPLSIGCARARRCPRVKTVFPLQPLSTRQPVVNCMSCNPTASCCG